MTHFTSLAHCKNNQRAFFGSKNYKIILKISTSTQYNIKYGIKISKSIEIRLTVALKLEMTTNGYEASFGEIKMF